MSEFNYTPEELKAMKNEYGKQATQQQFDLWLAECRNRGLVPMKDVVLQIRATKEWNPETRQKEFVKKAVHITTIQALRKLAERTGKYAGQLPSLWIYLDPDGGRIESDIPLPEPGTTKKPRIPWAAKASVLRTGFAHPITVPARFEAYAQYYSTGDSQSLNSTWANRGPEQLEKCAEALALRKAFPEELGGLFLQEELRDEETVATVAQENTETVQPLAQDSEPRKQSTAPAEKPKRGRPAKKETVKDSGKPWAGEFEQKPEIPSVAVPAVGTSPDNIHGVSDLTDADVPFPGDDVGEEAPKTDLGVKAPEPAKVDNRPANAEERKAFMDRLIKLKNAGYTGIREFLLKESGVQITNDIPYTQMSVLVDKLEAAEKAGNLKELLG